MLWPTGEYRYSRYAFATAVVPRVQNSKLARLVSDLYKGARGRNVIGTGSTADAIHVEICSVCHPYYTGKQRLLDTAGRVERFKRKYEKAG